MQLLIYSLIVQPINIIKKISGWMDKIAAKTFASQFLELNKSEVVGSFQRLVLAVKNNRCDLLACIPATQQQLKAKDQAEKNLLFYAVYEKCALALLYLLRAGLPYNELDNEHKNLYHFIAYSGSIQCLQNLNFFIKLTKIQKLNQKLLSVLSKYGYKRTDMKAGKLKYSVSPKREAQFEQLQAQATEILQSYLDSYLNELSASLSEKEEVNQRNPIHLVCLNKYQKCLSTLQQLIYQLINPELELKDKLLTNTATTNSYFEQQIDPRVYEETLHCLKQIPSRDVVEKIMKNYEKQARNKIKQIIQGKDKDGRSPLYIASKNGSTAMINLLQKYAPAPKVEQKQEIMKVAENNLARSHIIDLCEASHLADIKPLNFLISCGEEVNGKKTIFGTFALIQSLKSFRQNNSLEPIKALIKSGANVNIQDTNGWTVLHHAASMGLKQIVQLLLSMGKETNLQVNKVTNKRYHALHLAGMNEHPEIIRLLTQDKNYHIEIDIADWDGCTALIHAAKKGSLNVLKALLELKANIYAKDVRDMTALHHAAFNNHPHCIRELLNSDSDYDKLREMRNTKGKLAKDLCTDSKSFENVFTAARTGNVNLIRKLASENPTLKDSTTKQKERTPLILAVLAKSLPSVKFLVDIGADTYHQDKLGKSALAYCEQQLNEARSNKREDAKVLEQILKLLQ